MASQAPPRQFEIVVVESLPPDINLNMSLSQLTESKENSRLEVAKQQIYQSLVERLSPLLSDPSMSSGYNLLQLVQKVPLHRLVADLANLEISRSPDLPPMDFIVLILPRVANHLNHRHELPYQSLYSKRKASVIDESNSLFQAQMTSAEQINRKFDQVIQHVFEDQLEQDLEYGFFIGGLAGIQLRPEGVGLQLQLMGGLPTGRSFPFEQIEQEAHFREIRSPQTPRRGWWSNRFDSYPGAVATLTYHSQSEVPPNLRIQFGSLADLSQMSWRAGGRPEPMDELWLGSESFGITSFYRDFNVPHLVGDLLSPTGTLLVDWALGRDYFLKMNIFDVELDLAKLEITQMRIGVELTGKDDMWGVLPLPSLEMEGINQKFVDAGNQALAPYREQLEPLLGGDIFALSSNPPARAIIYQALEEILQPQLREQP